MREDSSCSGDIYLLCSDGVTDMINDRVIRNTIRDHDEDLEQMAAELIRASNQAGGKDNISVILARPLKSFPAPDSLFSRFFDLFS